jgi:hypothetical protein
MEMTTLYTQNQSLTPIGGSGGSSRHRRWRRRSSEVRPSNREPQLSYLGASSLGNSQERSEALFTAPRHVSRLDRLKALRFTPFGRRDRVEQSLAALHQPSSFHLTAEDWHWLDENSDIENEFE